MKKLSNIIEVNNLSKWFKINKFKSILAMNNVTMSIKEGEVVGLLGSNGAGKTTLIKTICGLIKPDSGYFVVNNNSSKGNKKKIIENISTVLETERNLYDKLTVIENFKYIIENNGYSFKSKKDNVENLLYKFNLHDFTNQLVGKLSRGMKQKLAIALSLSLDTKIIILDEPTLGLDVPMVNEIKKMILDLKKLNKTIIVCSHDMSLVEDVCERVIIMNKGEIIIDGNVDDLTQIFRSKQYEIVYTCQDSDKSISKLKEIFNVTKIDIIDNYIKVTLTLFDSTMLYKLINTLEKFNSEIININQETINFEKVFLNIINGQETK